MSNPLIHHHCRRKKVQTDLSGSQGPYGIVWTWPSKLGSLIYALTKLNYTLSQRYIYSLLLMLFLLPRLSVHLEYAFWHFQKSRSMCEQGTRWGMESPRIRENLTALILRVTVQRLLGFSMLSAPLRNTQSDSRGPIYSGKWVPWESSTWKQFNVMDHAEALEWNRPGSEQKPCHLLTKRAWI